MPTLSLTRKMSDAWLDTVEQRLEILEQLVFQEADKDAAYPKDAEKVIDTLASLHSKVDSAIAGRNKIEHLMKRLPELELYMDPAYTDKLTLSQAAKAEIVLAEEELLRQQAANLQKVQEMLPILNSEHIKGKCNPLEVVPSLQGQLQALSTVHLKQQDDASEVTEDIKHLLLYYNNVITLLSKQFVQWDELVTQLEIAQQTKKIDD